MFTDTKSIFTSVTVWGTLVAILATVAQLAGYDIGNTDGLAEQITALVGSAVAIYGRLRATKKLGKS